MSPTGWITALVKDERKLPSAISEVVEVSKTAADILLRHFRVAEADDFRRTIDRTLERRFSRDLRKKAHLVGASNKEHTFDYLIHLKDDRSLVIDTVVPDASSVNAALVSHLDLKNAHRPGISQAIVYDDTKEWRSSDLALLNIASPPIAFSRFNQQLERIAA